MNKEIATEVLEQFLLLKKIEDTILEHYDVSSINRVRRGDVHRLVERKLNLVLNPTFYRNMNRVTNKLGLNKVLINGVGHYKGLTEKKGKTDGK